jgi:hypothetical protein
MWRAGLVIAGLLNAVPSLAQEPRLIEASARVVLENEASVIELQIAASDPARTRLTLQVSPTKPVTSRRSSLPRTSPESRGFGSPTSTLRPT